VAVIGCGVQGRVHLTAYRALDEVEVVAVCDLDRARLETAQREFAVPHGFTDYRDLLASAPVDLVSICAMPVTHREMTVAALEAGAHVLCEKPMAMNAAEAEEMVATARRRGRWLSVGYNLRFSDAAQFARRFVDEGRLGTPQYARVYALANDIPWWGKHYHRAISGGGVLASTAVHVLDLTLWILGTPRPVTATATMLTRFPERRGSTAPSPEAAALYDVEDFVSGHIRLANGVALTLEAAWAYDSPLQTDYGFDLTGSRARLRLDPLLVVEERDGAPVEVTPAEIPPSDWPLSVKRELADVVAAVREGRPPLVTGEQALVVQQLTDALYESARLGREVQL